MTGMPTTLPRRNSSRGWGVLRITVVVGLTVGWVLGAAGGFFEAGTVRTTMWSISSIGIMAAAAVLAIDHSDDDRVLASGMVLLALGETVIHSQGAEAIDAVAAATYAYVPALLLIAASPWSPIWSRATAAGSAVAFAVHAGLYMGGRAPAVDDPAISVGYGLLALSMIGWTIKVVRHGSGD